MLIQATISDVLLIVGGIAMLLIPLSALIWLIRKLCKKNTKKNKVWTVALLVTFLLFENTGISLQCDHSYQLMQTVPPTHANTGLNTYICGICGNEKTTEIDLSTYYGSQNETQSNANNSVKSNIVGIWECSTDSSYDGTFIKLTITQQNHALIFERKAVNNSKGIETDIVFIVNEFNESSAYQEDTQVTYLRTDDLLYEVTASDEVNIYTFCGYVDVSIKAKPTTPTSTSSYQKYSSGSSTPARKRAMTAEEADKLRGTGYHGTRPGSPAEHNELRAAQVTCKECGYHSDNGVNSICDYCYSQKKNSN